MRRVLVIGCPGSGKSTFARALSAKTGLPLVYLDQLYWNTDRTTVPRSEFNAHLAQAMAQPFWIIDGNYGATMAQRMAACDTVFFLDFPTEVCLDGIRARRGHPRPDLPWIESGEADPEFMDFVRNYRVQSRPKVLALLQKYSTKNIYIFRSRAESDAFLAQLPGAEQK